MTTVPAGNQPSPGMTSVIATLPPTLTTPGRTFERHRAAFTVQSDDGSSVNSCGCRPQVRPETHRHGEERVVVRERRGRHERDRHTVTLDHGGASQFAGSREHSDSGDFVK